MRLVGVLFVSILSISTAALADSGPVGEVRVCPKDEQDLHARGRCLFDQYLQGIVDSKAVKYGARLPFVRDHGERTRYAAVLVHGLSDSPFSMRALADIFFESGMNVVAILLPGHGTQPEDLERVKLSEWTEALEWGVEVASFMGQNVVIGGYSTGAALAIRYAFVEPDRVAGLFLFAPALGFFSLFEDPMNWLGNWAWAIKHFKTYREDNPDTIPDSDSTRYSKMAVNAVGCLSDLMEVNTHLKGQASRHWEHKIQVPVFIALTESDTVIDPEPMKQFTEYVNGPKEVFSYPKERGVLHGSLTRPDLNPYYDELCESLEAFVSKHFSAAKPNMANSTMPKAAD